VVAGSCVTFSATRPPLHQAERETDRHKQASSTSSKPALEPKGSLDVPMSYPVNTAFPPVSQFSPFVDQTVDHEHHPTRNEREYRPASASSSGLRLLTTELHSGHTGQGYGEAFYQLRDKDGVHRRTRSDARQGVLSGLRRTSRVLGKELTVISSFMKSFQPSFHLPQPTASIASAH
jgi:hypothetical protein